MLRGPLADAYNMRNGNTAVHFAQRKAHAPPRSGKHMDGKPPAARAVTSLYGEETADFRAWVADYIVRNKDMLDLMARL